jgi:nucleoid-associated protein YgaU
LNRSLIVGVVGAVIVAAAIALTYFFESEPVGSPAAEAPKTDEVAKPDSTKMAAGTPAPVVGDKGPSAPTISGQPVRPKFDVVRISPSGNAVIAGRAAPHAEITVTDQNKEVGKVKADARGEWVIIPEKPLKSGSHELSLESRKSGGTTEAVLSKEKVVLVVPEKGKDIAGRKITGKSGALALAVPRDGSGGTTVLQKPAMSPERPVAKVVERSSEELAAAKARVERTARVPSERTVVAKVVDKVAQPKANPNAKLSMDAIDYNEAGKVEMSGRAPSGSRVQVYLDNKPLGAAQANKSGAWRVKPGKKVPPGLYKMRVDHISKSGNVVARVELPFSRAKPLGKLPNDAVVFVQPGHSLWRIARNTYGKGLSYAVIYEANRDQIRNPNLIYPGQIFHLPKVN